MRREKEKKDSTKTESERGEERLATRELLFFLLPLPPAIYFRPSPPPVSSAFLLSFQESINTIYISLYTRGHKREEKEKKRKEDPFFFSPDLLLEQHRAPVHSAAVAVSLRQDPSRVPFLRLRGVRDHHEARRTVHPLYGRRSGGRRRRRRRNRGREFFAAEPRRRREPAAPSPALVAPFSLSSSPSSSSPSSSLAVPLLHLSEQPREPGRRRDRRRGAEQRRADAAASGFGERPYPPKRRRAAEDALGLFFVFSFFF